MQRELLLLARASWKQGHSKQSVITSMCMVSTNQPPEYSIKRSFLSLYHAVIEHIKVLYECPLCLFGNYKIPWWSNGSRSESSPTRVHCIWAKSWEPCTFPIHFRYLIYGALHDSCVWKQEHLICSLKPCNIKEKTFYNCCR